MIADTFDKDIANTPDELLLRPDIHDDGHKTWPYLFVAGPRGYRPLIADLAAPPREGPHPLVVFIHGGAWWIGNPFTTNAVLEKMEIRKQLLAAGFAVARISYRLSSEGLFPMQLHDCKAAVRYFRKHAATLNLDPGKFATMGESAGGHLACMLGLTSDRPDLEGEVGVTGFSSAVQAVVDWYGPSEFLTMDEQRPAHAVQVHNDGGSPESHLIGGALVDHPEGAREASPIAYVSAGAPPFLIQHGVEDRLVPIGQARALAHALRSAGTQVTLSEIAGADHCFWGVETTPIVDEAIAFLADKLMPPG